MIKAFILVLEDKRIDPSHWVFLDKNDAIAVAKILLDAYTEDMDEEEIEELDKECYGENVFSCDAKMSFFTIYVRPIDIMEKGEREIDD